MSRDRDRDRDRETDRQTDRQTDRDFPEIFLILQFANIYPKTKWVF